MLILNPDIVTLDLEGVSILLPDVETIAIDRLAQGVITESDPTGPHPAFADVAQQQTFVRIERHLDRTDDEAMLLLTPGVEVGLAVRMTIARSDAGARTLRARVVIESIRHDLKRDRARQSLRAIAISADGADPITIDGDS